MSDSKNRTRPTVPKRRIFDTGFAVLSACTIIAGVIVWMQDGAGAFLQVTLETFGFLSLLTPKIIAGVFIAAALPLLLPREKVAAWIGAESGVRGLILAAVAGAVVPGGPMMAFPLAAGFVGIGADLGAVISYITSWSLLSLNRTLIWELSFLSSDMVAYRFLVCLPFPLILGLVVRVVIARRAG